MAALYDQSFTKADLLPTGGKHFSRDLRPLDADGNEISMWSADAQKKGDDDSDEEEDDEMDEERTSLKDAKGHVKDDGNVGWESLLGGVNDDGYNHSVRPHKRMRIQ